MNILIVSGIFPPDAGGPATYVQRMAYELSGRGHRVRLVTLADRLIASDGTPFHIVRIRRRSWLPIRMLQAVRAILREGRQADVLFVNGLPLESAIANFFLRRPLVQKIVGDWAWERATNAGRTTDDFLTFQRSRNAVPVEALKRLRGNLAARADRVIVPSAFLAETVAGWGVAPSCIRIIHNAIDPSVPVPMDRDERPNGPTIVTVGRLVTWKGVDDLIRAVSALPSDVHLSIVGDGPEEPRLRDLADALGSASRIRFFGRVDRRRALTIVAASDVFALNSTYEGLPHVVLEAMQLGVPVVATAVGGTGEVVRDGENGLLVPSGDLGALQGALARLLSDERLRRTIGTAGRATVQEFFGPERMVDETERELAAITKIPRVCFLGSTSYTRPLSQMQRAKWTALRSICKPHVVAFSSGLAPRRFHEEADFWLLPAIPLRIVNYGVLVMVGTLLAGWVLITRRIDVVVAQSPYEGVAAAIARTLARMVGRNSALVVESHGNFETALLLGRNGWWTSLCRRIMSRAARFALRQADALRAISTATTRQLGEWGCTQPIVSFPTWTEIEVFLDSPLRTTSAPTPTIVYAGVLTPLKGVDVLLRAFASIAADFPDVQLRLVGAEVDARFAAALRQLAADLNIAGRVTFVGEVTQVELAGELARGSFLVLPSHSEGLGRVVLEAMAIGRAVLATNVGGIPDLVEQGKTGFLVPAGDVDALRDRLAWLLRHPEACAEMGVAGRARVVDSYSTAAYIKDYAELFDVALQQFHEDDAKTPVADIEPRHGR